MLLESLCILRKNTFYNFIGKLGTKLVSVLKERSILERQALQLEGDVK